MSRKELPVDIQKSMKHYHEMEGMVPFPIAYTEWHKTRAEEELLILKDKYGLTIHSQYMRMDGWMMDEEQELNVVFETKSGKLGKMYWYPDNQEFFICGCGSAPAREKDFV